MAVTTRDWAQRYIDAGYQVVPLWPGTKKGKDEDFLKLVFTPEDFETHDNLGLRSVNGLVVVDLDAPEAVEIADDFLPSTDAIYGRPSKPRSKRLFKSAFPKTVPFKFGGMVVEIRSEHQDMAPPSVHPSGEPLEWTSFGEPSEVAPEALTRSCRLLTTAVLIARHYAPPGERHDDWGLPLAGTLRVSGVTKEEADKVIAAAARLANDAKVDDRLLEVRTTYNRVEGVSVLKEPEELVAALTKIWGKPKPIVGPDTILVEGGKLTEIVDRAQAKLLERGEQIYQRGGQLFMPVRQEGPQDLNGVKRQRGSLVLSQLREAKLIELLGRVSKWQSGQKPVDPPPIYARTLLAREDWPFPPLRAVVNAPTLRRDGSVLDTPGYDAQTRLLLDFDAKAFPPVPLAPTRDDAAAALAKVAHPLRGFPFDGDAAKSVALAAMLTALVRPVLRTAPLFAFDAPTAGTGKSKLAEITGLIAMGIRPPALSQGKTAEEDEKRLSSVLMAGDPVLHIDNCERALGGDFLCSMLTQQTVQARKLGVSEMRKMETAAVVLASGNNLSFLGDMSRRVVSCRLDPKVEKPEEREFDFDCHAEVIAQRPELVVACLSVLRAYALAGFPIRVKPMDFPDFDWIRGALVWLDHADPADTRQSIYDSDPKRDELSDVMTLWETALKGEWIEVGEIAKRADAFAEKHEQIAARQACIDLRDKLIEVAQCRVWNGKSIGKWLRRQKDRVMHDSVFRCEPSRNGQKWRLDTRESQPMLSDWTTDVPAPIAEEEM